jgi:6-phosphogluconolactonase
MWHSSILPLQCNNVRPSPHRTNFWSLSCQEQKNAEPPALGLTLAMAGCGPSSSTTPVPTPPPPPPVKNIVPRFAYVANSSTMTGASYTLSGFSIEPSSGVLTPLNASPFDTANVPNSIAIHPNGRLLYTANLNSFEISGYFIDPVTGTLTPIAGSPFPAADNPGALTIHSSGKSCMSPTC